MAAKSETVNAGSGRVGSIDEDLLVDLTKGLCRFASPLGQEGPVAEYLRSRLRELGFATERQEVVEGRPNIIGILPGATAFRSVLLNGHLDMPMPFGKWRRDPFDPWMEGDILFGGGILDMKGGLASLVVGALAAAASTPTRGDIVLAAVVHHDTTGLGTKYFLDASESAFDYGIVGEPTHLQVTLSHAGAWGFEIETTGITRHQVRLEEGVNAITGMLGIVDRLSVKRLTYVPEPSMPRLPSLVVGTIEGGEVNTMTADRCMARGDIRFLPGMTVGQLKADVGAILDEVRSEMPGLGAEVNTYRQQWPYVTDVGHESVAAVLRAHEAQVGVAPNTRQGSRGISDAADMQRRGIDTVHYGPCEWKTEPDEGVAVAELRTAAAVYADAVAHLAGQPRS